MKMYRYIRSILKNVVDSQGSCFDEKLKIDLTTVHIIFNYIENQQAEITKLQADVESLKCCGNCKNDIYCVSPVCVQCTRGVQITIVSDKKDNWESK